MQLFILHMSLVGALILCFRLSQMPRNKLRITATLRPFYARRKVFSAREYPFLNRKFVTLGVLSLAFTNTRVNTRDW